MIVMYLFIQNIFHGGDIRKQLPMEAIAFDAVDAQWKQIMIRLNANKNAMESCHYPGIHVTCKVRVHLQSITTDTNQ